MQNVECVRGLSSSRLTYLSHPILKFSGSPPSILSICKQVHHTFSLNKHIKRTQNLITIFPAGYFLGDFHLT